MAQSNRQYWLWVSTPEYYEEYDGSDRECLEPDVYCDGWTCHKNTKKGDIILLYRAKKKKDFAHVIRAEEDAYSAPTDYRTSGKGWAYSCGCRTVVKLKHPITLQDLRKQKSFFWAQWSAYRVSFMGTAFEIPSNVWEELISIAKQKNPSDSLGFLCDPKIARPTDESQFESNLEQIVTSDLVPGQPDDLVERTLKQIMNSRPAVFEMLVMRLLECVYDYGSSRKVQSEVTPLTGDGGIDGTLTITHPLGSKEVICVQAKRWKDGNNVGRQEIQKFVGSMINTNKGIFVTTSKFTKGAEEYVELIMRNTEIILINGDRLVELMKEHDLINIDAIIKEMSA